MSEIKAFVGHSFNEEDSAVVGAFLTYFDSLAQVQQSFSWQSARAAKPKELAEKVLELIADKNVFIGICTRKEKVFPPDSLQPTLFRKQIGKVDLNKVQWKTTDWLIQEIGMARGRGLKLILLVEEGVRQPGGLQGNIEYIEFTREAPERSFPKINQMITDILPHVSTAGVQTPDSKSDKLQEVENAAAAASADDGNTPKPEWKYFEYHSAFLRMLFEDNDDGARKIHDSYLEKLDAIDKEKGAEWTAECEYYKFLLGRSGNIAKLKSLTTDYPENSNLLEQLAKSFSKIGEHEKAAETFELAIAKTSDSERRGWLQGQAATALTRSNNMSAAQDKLAILRRDFSKGALKESTLLYSLLAMAELAKDEEAEIAVRERMVELDPDDAYARATLAYKYMELGSNDLSLHHYQKVPSDKRTGGVWNNLGVCLHRLGLSAKSVAAYREAEEKGDSLAMSNLGQKLLQAGFVSEAKAVCDKALKVENYDARVGALITDLGEVDESENKKREEILEKSKLKLDFYKKVGRASSQGEPSGLARRWKGPECELTFTRGGKDLALEGQYEVKSGGLLAMAIGAPGHSRTVKYDVRVSISLNGRSGHGKITRKSDTEKSIASTYLGMDNEGSKLVAILSEDDRTIEILENPHSVNAKFYKFDAVIE
jgi:Flp pilus assembly protein TadD